MPNQTKTYVLDTGILLVSPYSVFSFEENTVCIADASIEALTNIGRSNTDAGRNAREAVRIIKNLQQNGNLIDGIKLPNGGVLRVLCGYDSCSIPISWDKKDESVRILMACKHRGEGSILVSNDLDMNLKASMMGIRCEPYKTDRAVVDVDEQYSGRGELYVPTSALNLLYTNGSIPAEAFQLSEADKPIENEYFILHDVADQKHTGLAIYQKGTFKRLEIPNVWGVKPRNVGQTFALHALMAPPEEIPCVILRGSAGTGKSFLAVAAALQSIIENWDYTRCLITRPNVELDRVYGFLKGSLEDKMKPVVTDSVMDSLEQLTRGFESRKDGSAMPNTYANELFSRGILAVQALGFLRGRSLSNQILLIDEAQNTSSHQLFSVVTRIGMGSKIIIAGDPEQIDLPSLDSRTNGLVYVSERMKGSPLVAQIAFNKDECVRSPLAAEAISRMAPKGTI